MNEQRKREVCEMKKNMTTKKIWKICEKATKNDRSLRKQEQMG